MALDPRLTDIAALRLRAKRRLPRAIFDYVDGGSYTERSMSENRSALDRLKLVQRVMRNVSDRDLSTSVLGQEVPAPMLMAPTGLTGLVHPNGEVEALRVAQKLGLPFIHSTSAICSADDLGEHVGAPYWFQIYIMKDRAFTQYLLDMAKRSGATTLVITVDLVVNALRHRDTVNGLSVPLRLTARSVLNGMTKPGWALRMLRARRVDFGNYADYLPKGTGTQSMAKWVATQFEPLLTPENLGWIRDAWDGPIVIKGIMTPEDARTAVDYGAQAVVVSNHGGRQLDAGRASIDALPAIAAEVNGAAQVYADSGIRTGADIFRFLALGADACLIGRAALYGMGAAGPAGLEHALTLLRSELDVAMALTGCRTVADITPDLLHADETHPSWNR